MATETGKLTGEMGVITNIADPLRPGNFLRGALNVNMIRSKLLTSRYNGWTKQRASAFNGGGTFLDFSVFVGATGARTLVFQCGDDIYSYDLVTTTETEITNATNLDTTRPPCMRMFQPDAATALYMVYCNGVDQPLKITGITAGAYALLQLNGGNYPQTLSAPLPAKLLSKPKFCEPFLDRMVYAGFTGDGVFDIMITNSGDAQACTQSAPLLATDGGLFQVDPQLGPITGLKAFKLTNEANDQVVLICQSHGVSVLIGKDAEDFQVFTLTQEYGIPSNRAFVQLGSDIYFLADDGIRQFSTLVSNANLINTALTYRVQDLVQRFNDGALQWAHAVHHRGYQEIQFWYPNDSDTQCKNALVFSYNTDPLTPAPTPQVAIFPRDGTSVASSIYFDKTFYGGGYDGLLQKHHDGNTYNGAVINWSIDLAQMQPATLGALAELARARILMVGGDQKFLVESFYYAVMGDKSIKRKQAQPESALISSPSGGGTVLDTWRLGIDSFPGEHLRFADYRPSGGKGIAWELSFRGNDSSHQIDFLGVDYKLMVEESDE